MAYNEDGRAFIRAMCGGAAAAGDAQQQQPNGAQPPVLVTRAAADAAAATATATAADFATAAAATAAAAGEQPADDLPALLPIEPVLFDHAVMNLPASAIEFVDAFRGAFNAGVWEGRPLPLVHCYTFRTASETSAGAS